MKAGEAQYHPWLFETRPLSNRNFALGSWAKKMNKHNDSAKENDSPASILFGMSILPSKINNQGMEMEGNIGEGDRICINRGQYDLSFVHTCNRFFLLISRSTAVSNQVRLGRGRKEKGVKERERKGGTDAASNKTGGEGVVCFVSTDTIFRIFHLQAARSWSCSNSAGESFSQR